MIAIIWLFLFLLFTWCAFSNNFSIFNILIGSLAAAGSQYLSHSDIHETPFRIRSWQLIKLVLSIAYELCKSSVLVAWEILTPSQVSDPKILYIPLNSHHSGEKTLTANLFSLTPGTLSIDLSADEKTLVAHIMFAHDEHKVRTYVQDYLEPRVIRVFDDA